MLPDLCDLKKGINMPVKTDLALIAHENNSTCCYFLNTTNSAQIDHNFSPLQYSDSESHNVDEFLLPDLNDLQGALSTSRSGLKKISIPSNEIIFSDKSFGLHPQNQTRFAWQAELTRAFETLSAFEIVDHGLINDE